MLIGIFVLLLAAVLLAWSGWRRFSIAFFTLGFIIGILRFWHHVTDTLNLQL